jgi:hypothetical protein
VARLQAGVTFGPSRRHDERPNKGGRGMYVEDPDGNAVEVVQLAPQAAA